MRPMTLLLTVAVLFLVSCGGDEPEAESPASAATASSEVDGAVTAEPKDEATAPKRERAGAADKAGTEIVLDASDFGDMLYDADQQAIYVFENDRAGETTCFDECAEAWPPVFTDSEPVAGDGVDAKLLGTLERDDGRMQVTYAGRPLYYYAHEEPGQVLCHNVDLNGGLWWVVGADGEPLA